MKSIAALFFAVALSVSAYGENWPQFRGPTFNGSTTETNLPDNWSRTENIAWTADLPGASAATPIVWEDHVFISSTNPENDTLNALCFDRQTGKLLWQHEVAKGIRRDDRSTFAEGSPATDGKLVVFFYGSGPLVAYDFSGRELWSRNIQDDYGEFAFQWTFATSPLLFDGKLYIQVLQRDAPARGHGMKDQENKSYILALEPETGKELWRHIRPSQAVAESREAFSTPVPYQAGGRKQLLVIGGDDLTGHDPATGKELWRWGTWNPTRIRHWRHVTSPIAGDDIILVCAPKQEPIYAIESGGTGLLDDRAVAWVSRDDREVAADVPTPAFYDGDFFVLNDLRRMLCRVEPRTGEVKWRVRTPGSDKYEASPLAADGKIYLMNFVGDVVIVSAKSGEILNNISMDDPGDENVRSTISAAQGQLFVRTNRKLYCVGK